MSSYNKHLFKSVVSLCFSLAINQNYCSVDTLPQCNHVLPREGKVSREFPGSCSEFIHADTCLHSHLLTLPTNLVSPHTFSATTSPLTLFPTSRSKGVRNQTSGSLVNTYRCQWMSTCVLCWVCVWPPVLAWVFVGGALPCCSKNLSRDVEIQHPMLAHKLSFSLFQAHNVNIIL